VIKVSGASEAPAVLEAYRTNNYVQDLWRKIGIKHNWGTEYLKNSLHIGIIQR